MIYQHESSFDDGQLVGLTHRKVNRFQSVGPYQAHPNASPVGYWLFDLIENTHLLKI